MPPKLLALSFLLRTVALLPLATQRLLGRALGRALYRWDKRSVRLTRTNISLCFPQLDDSEQERMCRATLEHTGMAFSELSGIYYWRPEKIRAAVQCSDLSVLETALSEGNGVILAAPHFGNWEMIGQYLSTTHAMHVLYRPAKNEDTDRYVLARRSRLGAHLHPTQASGVRGLTKALRQGELIGILPDQEPDRDGGVFAPFFGHPALTMTLLSKLAKRRQTPVLLTYMRRSDTGYVLHLERLSDAIYSDDPQVSATELNRCIEQMIMQYPLQYIWNYKRFATRPNDEPSLY